MRDSSNQLSCYRKDLPSTFCFKKMSYLTNGTCQNERNFNQMIYEGQTCSIVGEIHVVNRLEFRVEVFQFLLDEYFTKHMYYLSKMPPFINVV